MEQELYRKSEMCRRITNLLSNTSQKDSTVFFIIYLAFSPAKPPRAPNDLPRIQTQIQKNVYFLRADDDRVVTPAAASEEA
jgi:hypothetical protein